MILLVERDGVKDAGQELGVMIIFALERDIYRIGLIRNEIIANFVVEINFVCILGCSVNDTRYTF